MTYAPPIHEAWKEAAISEITPAASGQFTALLTMQGLPYWVRAYRKEGGVIRFEYQPRMTVKEAAEWITYLDNLAKWSKAG